MSRQLSYNSNGFKNDQVTITFEPVHAATTSWMLQGVTTTINPKDTAAIVRDTDPLKRLSWKLTLWKGEYEKCRFIQFNWHSLNPHPTLKYTGQFFFDH